MSLLHNYSSSDDDDLKQVTLLPKDTETDPLSTPRAETTDVTPIENEYYTHTRHWEKNYILPALMTLMVILIVVFIFIMILAFLALALIFQSLHVPKRMVLMIGIDGFRHDYFDLYGKDMPNIMELRAAGVRADKMRPIFPTKTFPNHYTLVTGLYAESHGIVSNDFYDPVFEEEFRVGKPSSWEAKFWDAAEPVWLTLQRNGLKSATVFWPGSDVPIHGEYPTYYTKYDHDMSHKDRVSILFENFDRPTSERADFLTMYFSDVDTAGHNHGPNSPEVRNAIRLVDASIASIIDGLDKRSLLDHTDIIILSDHGMTSIPHDKFIDLRQFVNTATDASVFNYGPMSDLYLLPGANLDDIFAKVNNVHPNMVAYKKADIPTRFHYTNNRRIPDILVVANSGYTIIGEGWSFENQHGNHGYDNDDADMQAIFIASGPSFLNGGKAVEGFDNVHVYSLICHLLHVENIAPNNGTIYDIHHVLKEEFRKKNE